MKHLSPILDREAETEATDYRRDQWSLVRCLETGLVFLPDPPEYSELESDYSWEKTTVAERERRIRDEPVFSKVSSFSKWLRRTFVPRGNKMAALAAAEVRRAGCTGRVNVLDLGCGGGGLLVEAHSRLRDHGCEAVPVGVEVSKAIAADAAARLGPIGGRVIQSSAFEAANELSDDSFQIILMCSFLEHEKHPCRLLRSLRRVLAPDGAVILKVPNFDSWNRRIRGSRWCGFRYPDHVNYFTPATLRALAGEAGFRVSRQTLSDRFPTSDNMYAVLSKAAD